MRGRRLILVVIVACSLALGWDLTRPPDRQMSAQVLRSSIGLYQATLSPVLRRAGTRCRFRPTCSRYGEIAIKRHGALVGSWMAIKRIFRCGPWTEMGTYDPPPGVDPPAEASPPAATAEQ